MPVQTTKTSNIYFPDGAKVSVQPGQTGAWFDVGAINSPVTAVLNWDENQVETANAGKTEKQIRNMTIEGGFTLINLEPEGVEKLGGGVFTRTTVAATEVTAFTNQSIATFVANRKIPLTPVVTATGLAFKFNAAPVLTSVTASTSGVLAANNDYTIVQDDCPSGYSIVFNTAGTATVATSETVVIVFGANTPAGSEVVYAGASTAVLTAYAMKITHTDDNNKVRQLELFSVDPNSGGFTFGFKGANEDGLEEMPLTFISKIDTTRTTGRQLMAWTVESGAM
jgi:hypothetical protein